MNRAASRARAHGAGAPPPGRQLGRDRRAVRLREPRSATAASLYHADDQRGTRAADGAAVAQRQLEERSRRRGCAKASAPRSTGCAPADHCFSCGRLKPRASSRCDWCGDEPVTHNGDPREFDRAWGYP